MPSDTTILLSYLGQLLHQLTALIPNQHANEAIVLTLIHQIQQTVGHIMGQHTDEISYPPYTQPYTSQPIGTNTVPTLTIVSIYLSSVCNGGIITWNYDSIPYDRLHERVQRSFGRPAILARSSAPSIGPCTDLHLSVGTWM